MNNAVRQFVRERAGNRCEYCLLQQEDSLLAALHVEHVIPKKHGGTDDAENLALAYVDCNLHKGSNLAGIDPMTGQTVVLYNPRSQAWNDHFEWRGITIAGKTDIGRTTVRVLDMNSEDQLSLRSS
jgi:5-methylcytosine-specific restriction endonuclease McrA